MIALLSFFKKKHTTNWLELPKVLWELVFERLDLLDSLRFGAVCSLFQSIMVERQAHRLFSPLLMLPGKEDSNIREFFSFSDNKKYKIPVPELSGKWCFDSSYGWLFTIDFSSDEINLLNPISRAQVRLPPLSTFSDPPGLRKEECLRNFKYLERATISTHPGINNDFVVVAIFTDLRVFAFCRPGDTKWTTLTRHGDHCEDVIYYQKKFYAITNWGALKVWDHCHVDAPVETMIPAPKNEECLRGYLVEYPTGELLKVCRYTEWVEDADEDDDGHSHTLKFEVYKLDENNRRWAAVKSLDDKALFLGYNRAVCLSTLKYPEFKANCIYYTDDYIEGYFENPHGAFDMGMFSLADKSIKLLFKNSPFWPAHCIWMSPTLC